MTVDIKNLMMSSTASSQKLIKEGTGTLTIPAFTGPGVSTGLVIIPHGHNSDKLLFQVVQNDRVSPYGSNDNRRREFAYIDNQNLYIVSKYEVTGSTSEPAISVPYSYRILIP